MNRSTELIWVSLIVIMPALGCGPQDEKQTERVLGEAMREEDRNSAVSLEAEPAEEAVESHSEPLRAIINPWPIIAALGGIAAALLNPRICTFPDIVCKTACNAPTWLGGRNCSREKSGCKYSNRAERYVCQCADARGTYAHTCH